MGLALVNVLPKILWWTDYSVTSNKFQFLEVTPLYILLSSNESKPCDFHLINKMWQGKWTGIELVYITQQRLQTIIFIKHLIHDSVLTPLTDIFAGFDEACYHVWRGPVEIVRRQGSLGSLYECVQSSDDW